MKVEGMNSTFEQRRSIDRFAIQEQQNKKRVDKDLSKTTQQGILERMLEAWK